ncbi:hypothetical protein [Marinobacter confluentis]|uniref:Uncharacterized protein n=1 Tax=Marinobacter confluentis TaxID=1697557 RepID=A0A4Z1BCB9_9GAMM|nr:hypothetical protein [Marinobacter confluentis]TGN39834.1 hypothetical protein E5Q11_05890 [Marinobacter confluentis]
MRDLEIYIRDLDLLAVRQWLGSHLDQLDLPGEELVQGVRPIRARAAYNGCDIRATIYPQAGGKRYASLIIEGAELPWDSDLECGRSAWQALATEIRCSPGDWKEGEPVEDERWWRIDQRGEQLAVWN